MFWLQENVILMKEMGNSAQSFIRKEVTSYKICILGSLACLHMSDLDLCGF